MSSGYYEKIPYCKINKVLWRWKRFGAENGCYPVPDLAISMDNAPPPLPNPARHTPPPKPIARSLTHVDRVNNTFDGLLSTAQGISRFTMA